MTRPIPQTQPSERTVEVLTNHFILHRLNKSSAWIFCPTTVEELTRGYDSALQNTKMALIQYKRVRVNKSSIAFEVDQQQYGVLMNRFKPHTKPYVFYCFSLYTSHEKLNNDFNKVGSPYFFEKSLFINAHDLPVLMKPPYTIYGKSCRPPSPFPRYTCGSVNYSPKYGIRVCSKLSTYSSINYWDGHKFINNFRSCNIGLPKKEMADVIGQDFQDRFVRMGVNLLMWKYD